MAARFDLYKLSLIPRIQLSLLDEFAHYSKEQWIRHVFGSGAEFSQRKAKYTFVLDPEISNQSVLVGRIGKPTKRRENLSPQEGLKEHIRDAYRASLVVLDPTPNDDGQKLAVEVLPELRATLSLVKNMIQSFNEKYPDAPYDIEVAQAIDTQHFWAWVEENEGTITNIQFELIAPNMGGISDDLEEDMKEWREGEKAQVVKIGVRNKDGKLNPKTKRMKNAVKYAEQHSGTIKARTKKGKKYNSAKSGKHSYVEGIYESGKGLTTAVVQFANRILGRE